MFEYIPIQKNENYNFELKKTKKNKKEEKNEEDGETIEEKKKIITNSLNRCSFFTKFIFFVFFVCLLFIIVFFIIFGFVMLKKINSLIPEKFDLVRFLFYLLGFVGRFINFRFSVVESDFFASSTDSMRRIIFDVSLKSEATFIFSHMSSRVIPNINLTYSQYLKNNYLNNGERGFIVDIGANDGIYGLIKKNKKIKLKLKIKIKIKKKKIKKKINKKLKKKKLKTI
jgi:hypothetical protein